jgi:hypothetical protein
MSANIEDTLNERGSRYGDFRGDATIAQALKEVLRAGPSWGRMKPWHREALEHICTKLARITHGDPDYIDNYEDIAGYATLVKNTLYEQTTEAR